MELPLSSIVGSSLIGPLAIVIAIGLTLVAGRYLNRFRQAPVGERRRLHLHGGAGLAVAALIALAFGLLSMFNHTERRSLVPAFDYVSVGRYGSTSYTVTDTSGTRYLATWNVFQNLHTGATYSCEVRVYAVLLRPKLLSCTLDGPVPPANP